MRTGRTGSAGSGWRVALAAALALCLIIVLPGPVAAGIDPWSGAALRDRAGTAGPGSALPGPSPLSAWRLAPGGGTGSRDSMLRLRHGMHDRPFPKRGRRAATGLLAFVGEVSAVYDVGNGYVKRVMNPRAFGFQIHLDLALSLRRPGNGFVITRRF